MARLYVKKAYLTIGELLSRWDHTYDDFQYIIENRNLDVYVRPLALRAALPPGYAPKLERCPLDPTKVCRLVHDKQDQVKVQDFQDAPIRSKADIAFEINIGDVVILMADVEELEKEYSETTDEDIEIVSCDYRHIRVGDREYTFGEKQAAVVKHLYEQMRVGNPWVNGKTLLKVANASGIKMHGLFSRNKNWRQIIESDSRGCYRLHP